MTVRVYLMPLVTQARGRFPTVRVPKYMATLEQPGCPRFTVFPYAQEPVCLLIADTDASIHTSLTGNSDVRALPDNLDSNVTAGNRTAVVNALEAANVPAHWIANGQTFRMVLRRLAGIFQLLTGVHARGFRFLQQGLDNQISTLPLNVRQAMQDAAATLQLDTTGITGSTTLRAALATIGAQFDSRPVLACRTSL